MNTSVTTLLVILLSTGIMRCQSLFQLTSAQSIAQALSSMAKKVDTATSYTQLSPTTYGIATATTTAVYNPLTGCVDINSTLAAQVGTVTSIFDPVNKDKVSQQCLSVYRLSMAMDKVINNKTPTSLQMDKLKVYIKARANSYGSFVTKMMGSFMNMFNKAFDNLVKSVDNVIDGTVIKKCGSSDGLIYTPTANAVSTSDADVCFNPGDKVIVNIKTGAYVQLDGEESILMTGLMNNLAYASSDVEVQSPVGLSNVNNRVVATTTYTK